MTITTHLPANPVTVLDGAPHSLAILAAVGGAGSIDLRVTEFGQSGPLPDLYRLHGIGADAGRGGT